MNPQVNGSIKKLDKLAKDLQLNLEIVGKYTYEKLAEVMTQIESKKEELTSLAAKFDEQEREEVVDLALRVKRNEKETLESLATKFGFILMSREDEAKLTERAVIAERDSGKAIGAAVGLAKRNLEFEHKESNMEMKSEMTLLRARLDQSNNENEFLSAQLTKSEEQLKLAGQRMVEIAQSNNSSAITVSK